VRPLRIAFFADHLVALAGTEASLVGVAVRHSLAFGGRSAQAQRHSHHSAGENEERNKQIGDFA
jgi:hypothetical protein